MLEQNVPQVHPKNQAASWPGAFPPPVSVRAAAEAPPRPPLLAQALSNRPDPDAPQDEVRQLGLRSQIRFRCAEP
eukprot:1804110-Alexandrium_andersonii.AAC.1